MNQNKQSRTWIAVVTGLLISYYFAILTGCATHSVALQMNNQGLRYWNEGRYDLAEETLQRALNQAEQDLGPNDVSIGIILTNLGLVYTDEGKYAEAVDVYQRADPIIKESYGPRNPTYAQFLNNFGYAYLRYGRYSLAREKMEQSLTIYTAVGKSEADTANVTNGLSMTYRNSGDLAQAEKIANRALESVENDETRWGYKGPILQNLGTIYTLQGRFNKAEEVYTRVLKRREMKLGTSHPETGYTVAGLAVLYTKAGRYDEADAYYKRAIDIFERKLPQDHPDTVELIAQYADFLRSVGRSNEALEIEQRTHAQ